MPVLSRRTLWVPLLTTCLLAGGCSRFRSQGRAPPPPTTNVHVVNNDFLDAVVYVVHRGQSVRLGMATSNTTTTFVVPAQLIFGSTALSFVVDPVGAPRRQGTGEIVVDPGDDIELLVSGGRALLNKRTP